MAAHARLAVLLLPLLAAVAAPAAAVTQNASVNANVVRPLTLVSQQDLDLGTVTLKLGTWSGATVGISHTGVFTCNANLVCTGAPQVARYKVTGSNKMVVRITAPNVTLVNQSDSTKTLTMTLDNPGQVTLTSSGEPGNSFDLGGSITLSSTTAEGTYSGTLAVTVDYQ
jgi:spore coat protein U-like protein